MSLEILSYNLKLLRYSRNWKQQYVAHRINLTRNGYGNYERGYHMPRVSILKKISDLYCINIDELLNVRLVVHDAQNS